MEHVLQTELEVPVALDAVFAFFSRAENLERITPPELRFRMVTPAPVEMREGLLLDYRLSLLGVPFSWRSRITRFDPPRAFVDEQVKGPYKLWVHTHSFEPAAGGTLIRDHVRYRLPLSPLGELAYPLVRAHLGRIFAYRRRAVTRELGGGSAAVPGSAAPHGGP